MKLLYTKHEVQLFTEKEKAELFSQDFKELSSSYIPGEWVCIKTPNGKLYLADIDPFHPKGTKVTVSGQISKLPQDNEEEFVKNYLKNKIERAGQYRKLFYQMNEGARLFYGREDGISGLVVDLYQNCVVLQLSSLGLDRFRIYLKECYQDIFARPAYFLYSQKEKNNPNRVQFESEQLPALEVKENGLDYFIEKKVVQKAGYYYDHRHNRDDLENRLKNITISKSIGLDLFCYVGSWGMHLLRSGFDQVDFVDQGDFEHCVKTNVEKNFGSDKKVNFFRSDVFQYLDSAFDAKKKYQVVVSDPPAMAKTYNDKKSALQGYRKLHKKIMQVLDKKAFLAVGSCTQYVSMQELSETVSQAAYESQKNLKLISIGTQGIDHPTSGIGHKSNYIKYLLYYIEDNSEE